MAKQVFICEVCGKNYATEAEAVSCESNHITITETKSIFDPKDKLKYPSKLICTMSDGKTMMYFRKLRG